MGDRQGEGLTLNNLDSALANQGRLEEASDYYRQELAIARQVGDHRTEATTLDNLGRTLAEQGDAEAASPGVGRWSSTSSLGRQRRSGFGRS